LHGVYMLNSVFSHSNLFIKNYTISGIDKC
jgi:hypothetical protein